MFNYLIHEVGTKRLIGRELAVLIYFKLKGLLNFFFPRWFTSNFFYNGNISIVNEKSRENYQGCVFISRPSYEFDISTSRYPIVRKYGLREDKSSLYRLENVVVYGKSLAVTQMGRVIRGILPERKPYKQINSFKSYDIKELFNSPIITLHGEYAVVVSKNIDNYYHFMFDFLPKLITLIGYGFEKILLPRNIFTINIVELLAIDADKLVFIDSIMNYRIQKSIIPSIYGVFGLSSYSKVSLIRKVFCKIEIEANMRVYITRKSAKSRRVLNEKDLVEKLISLDFKVIDMRSLSIREQISLFSQTNIVVSPHGAGLTNIVFMREGSHLIEMFPMNQINDCYFELSSFSGLRYDCIIGQDSDENSDFNCDVDLITSKVINVIESIS